MRRRTLNSQPRIGRYRLLRSLGSGSYGSVHLAVQEGEGSFSRRVAMKRLHKAVTREPRFVSMLVREARIGGLMNHDNVVSTLDLIKLGEEYILVTDFVDGMDFSDLVHRARGRKEPLHPAFVAELGYQIAQGLAYIHGLTDLEGQPLNLVHRHLKPSNVLIHHSGSVKLADFGVARSAVLGGVTAKDGVMGTPRYMSPEQALGWEAGPQSDLYSLGVILCEALYLKVPGRSLRIARLPGASPTDVASPPEKVLEDLPPTPFTPLLLSLLQPDPADRPASAREVGETLDRLRRLMPPPRSSPLVVESLIELLHEESDVDLDDSLVVEFPSDLSDPDQMRHGGVGVHAPSGSTLGSVEHVQHLLASNTEDPPTPQAQHKAPWVVAGLAILMGLALGLGWLITRPDAPATTTTTTTTTPTAEPEPEPLTLAVQAPARALRNSPLTIQASTGTTGCEVVLHWRVADTAWNSAVLPGQGPDYSWTLDVTASHRPELQAWVEVGGCGQAQWKSADGPHVVKVW